MERPEDLAERLLPLLAAQGTASSVELQQRLGKSQPTISRLLKELEPRVVALGRGRSVRYGAPLPIHARRRAPAHGRARSALDR